MKLKHQQAKRSKSNFAKLQHKVYEKKQKQLVSEKTKWIYVVYYEYRTTLNWWIFSWFLQFIFIVLFIISFVFSASSVGVFFVFLWFFSLIYSIYLLLLLLDIKYHLAYRTILKRHYSLKLHTLNNNIAYMQEANCILDYKKYLTNNGYL